MKKHLLVGIFSALLAVLYAWIFIRANKTENILIFASSFYVFWIVGYVVICLPKPKLITWPIKFCMTEIVFLLLYLFAIYVCGYELNAPIQEVLGVSLLVSYAVPVLINLIFNW